MVNVKLDFRLLDVRTEIAAIRGSVVTMEAQLKALKEQRTTEVFRRLGPNADPADVQLARQELRWEVEYTYPRVYRGALLLVIWAAYESGVAQVADFLARHMSVSLSISDMRGRSVLDRANLYFAGVLNFDLRSSEVNAGRLGELALVRNAFAHVNGRTAGLSPSGRDAVESMVRAGKVDADYGYIVPTASYLAEAVDVIEAELTDLADRSIAWHDSQQS